MDSTGLILTALESAILAGGQSALNDTIKDAFISLKEHIVQKLAGKRNATLVLEEYEQDPTTWKQPLADLLARTPLSRDEEAIELAKQILKYTMQERDRRNQHTNIFHDTVQSSAFGNNNTNTFNITNTIAQAEDSLAKGRNHAQRGYKALLRSDYPAAKHALQEADQQLDELQTPAESAQAKFYFALALLQGQRPFSTAIQNMRRIEQLLRAAIDLQPLQSYYYTLALFKHDFARNGLPHYKHDAQGLGRQAQRLHRTTIDEENLQLLQQCQPRLINDSKQW